MNLESLEQPPIVEVVCGIHFTAIPKLDPISSGVYWSRRQADFPQYQLQPALVDREDQLLTSVPPMRTWLISQDDQLVLQIQSDRVYLNWRKRSSQYPRFNDHDGREGLLTKTLREFGELSAFCELQVGQKPHVRSIELAKIDHLIQGKHWDSFAELAALLPWLYPLAGFSRTNDPRLVLRFEETRASGSLAVTVATAIQQAEAGQAMKLLSLETRYAADLAKSNSSLAEAFTEGNAELNHVFELLIPEAKRDELFIGRVKK